jgi:riboflavin kinase/FMN adenylyltransferase
VTERSIRVSYGVESLPGPDTARAVSIGKFDGVHRGHQAVIAQLRKLAGDAEITVVTFDRHPRALFQPESVPEALLSLEQKIDLLGESGVQRVVVLEFTEEFAALEHAQFSDEIVHRGLGASLVLVGQDFRYGRHGAGNLETLRAEGHRLGFAVHTVADVVEEGGARISSTRVRELLHGGHVREAATLLGRYHCVRASVVAGHQRGRTLGYPTANLANPVEGLIPLDGVYASYVQVGVARYPAATSIGLNPTFGDLESRVVESHLFDFRGDLYGQRVSVQFVDYIRPMNQFPDAQALAHQMHLDSLKIREIVG